MRILVEEGPDRLAVEVRDDGCGISGEHRSRGLGGLRDRVESLGGAFDVGSATLRGTSVRACFERSTS